MVITIELNLIFKAYYEEESFNLEKYEPMLGSSGSKGKKSGFELF